MEYQVSVFSGKISDRQLLVSVNAHMKQWADDGWELHTVQEDRVNYSGVEILFFWRR